MLEKLYVLDFGCLAQSHPAALVELESQKVSETSLRNNLSALTESGLRKPFLLLPRLVSGIVFLLLLRLVSETFFYSSETSLRIFSSSLTDTL